MKASQCDWDIGAKPEKHGINEDEVSLLPELNAPCKYQKTAGGKLKIVCSYREQGAWKRHQKVVGVSISADPTFEGIIRNCEAEVMDFYSTHHEANAQELEPECDAPALMG